MVIFFLLSRPTRIIAVDSATWFHIRWLVHLNYNLQQSHHILTCLYFKSIPIRNSITNWETYKFLTSSSCVRFDYVSFLFGYSTFLFYFIFCYFSSCILVVIWFLLYILPDHWKELLLNCVKLFFLLETVVTQNKISDEILKNNGPHKNISISRIFSLLQRE